MASCGNLERAARSLAELYEWPPSLLSASGALVSVMSRYPLPEGGIFIVRPPGRHPARKIRALTEILIEHFGSPGDRTP